MIELGGARLAVPAGFDGATLRTVLLLTLSNVFMTFAWYAHLRNLADRPWWIAALVSWGIALFEYMLQVPANRAGYTVMTLPQLKIVQEAIALAVFVPFRARQPWITSVVPAGRSSFRHPRRRSLSQLPPATSARDSSMVSTTAGVRLSISIACCKRNSMCRR